MNWILINNNNLKVNWYDLAFYDMQMFENMRKSVKLIDEGADMNFDFAINLKDEEGGGIVCFLFYSYV